MAQDLAFAAIASFGTLFMGVIVYFHSQRSVSNKLYFGICLSVFFWAFANLFSLNAGPENALFWIRMVLFFAVPQIMLLFLFVYNFPSQELKIPKIYFVSTLTLMVLTMAAAISPLVFSGSNIEGTKVTPINGPLIYFFGVVILAAFIAGFVIVINKFVRAGEMERRQWKTMIVGLFLTYLLLIVTNFIFVTVLDNAYFVRFAPLFMLPAIFGMGYAILKHHLLQVKVITTEIMTFAILSISLFEIFVADGLAELILRIGLFSLFFFFGVLLIKSILREVEQKEELQILTKKLESANEKLQELDHMKSEFLSFASHQIKAPLAAIKGFATLINDGTYGQIPDKVKDAAQKIKDSADRMVQLVGDFLNVRKIEEGKMVYKMERVDAVKIIRSIFEELKLLAQNKGLEFTLDSASEGGWINADPQNIRQVYQNLMENAIKYTDKGFVKVRTESIAGKFIFSVSDSGHGISKELLPHLFEEFRRDALTTGKIEGTGLGLYIAHQITSDHGGEIWVESDGVGKGSKFLVKLPLA